MQVGIRSDFQNITSSCAAWELNMALFGVADIKGYSQAPSRFELSLKVIYRHSQILIVVSTLEVTTNGSLGWKSEFINSINISSFAINFFYLPRDVMKWSWACSVFVHRLCSIDQTLSVLSSLTEIRYFPFGCSRIPRTQLSCPFRVKRQELEKTSQNLIERSRDAEISKILGWSMLSAFDLAENIGYSF